MQHRAFHILYELDPDITVNDVRDIIWLASQLPINRQETSIDSNAPVEFDIPALPTYDPPAPPSTISGSTIDQTVDSVGVYSPSPIDQRNPQQHGNLSIRVPAASALPGALSIGRSLRPLKRRVQSRTRMVYDEEATIRRISDEGIWMPIMRPARSRWFDIAIVVDESASMLVWMQTIVELRRLLERHGAFRDVRVWHMRHHADEGLVFFAGDDPTPRAPNTIIDPSGHRLILVISDAGDKIWYTGAITEILQQWSRINPVTLVQPLTQPLWRRGALQSAQMVQLSGASAGISNLFYDVRLLYDSFDSEDLSGIKIPVLTLEPEVFALWSKMIAGVKNTWVGGVILPFGPISPPEELRHSAQIKGTFRSSVSPLAQRLAGMLAYTAPLRLPIMRLVQQTLLPHSRQVHLAEIILSGALTALPNQQGWNADTTLYEFQPEFLEILRDSVPTNEAAKVLRAISSFIEQELGHPLDFDAMLETGQLGNNDLTTTIGHPFAEVSIEFLKRCGGEYTAVGEKIEKEIFNFLAKSDHSLPLSHRFHPIVAALNKAEELIIQQRVHDAQYWCERALEQLERLPEAERAQFAMRAYSMAWTVLDFGGQHEEALRYAQQLYDLVHSTDLPAIEGGALLALGRTHRALRDFSAAEETLRSALDVARRSGNVLLEADALFHLGKTQQIQGRHLEAIQNYNAAHERGVIVDDRLAIAKIITSLGDVYRILGAGQQANLHYERALAIEEHLPGTMGIAIVQEKLALSYLELGEHERALHCQAESLMLREQINDEVGMARAYTVLGIIHSARDEQSTAIEAYHKALTIEHSLQNTSGQVMLHNRLGDAFRALNDYGEASSHYEQSLQLAQNLNDSLGIALTSERMGDLAYEQHDMHAAAQYWKAALFIRQELGHSNDQKRLVKHIRNLKL